jgi:hypothetical protein
MISIILSRARGWVVQMPTRRGLDLLPDLLQLQADTPAHN